MCPSICVTAVVNFISSIESNLFARCLLRGSSAVVVVTGETASVITISLSLSTTSTIIKSELERDSIKLKSQTAARLQLMLVLDVILSDQLVVGLTVSVVVQSDVREKGRKVLAEDESASR